MTAKGDDAKRVVGLVEEGIRDQRFDGERDGTFSLEKSQATPCYKKNPPQKIEGFICGGTLFGFPGSRLGSLNLVM